MSEPNCEEMYFRLAAAVAAALAALTAALQRGEDGFVSPAPNEESSP